MAIACSYSVSERLKRFVNTIYMLHSPNCTLHLRGALMEVRSEVRKKAYSAIRRFKDRELHQ
jgi:hypothetical protein